MMAVSCVARENRYIIATTSSTLSERDFNRHRWRQNDEGPIRAELTVPQPQVMEQQRFTSSSRQDDLRIKRKIFTTDWSFRVNCSVLVVYFVNSWML